MTLDKKFFDATKNQSSYNPQLQTLSPPNLCTPYSPTNPTKHFS